MATRIVETVVEYEPQPPCKTAEEMEELCCKPTDALQCCEHTEPNWQGYTAEELLKKYHPDLDDKGRDALGRYVIVEMAPRKKPCGEKVTEYDFSGGQCCDEVVPMVWDEDSCVDFIPDNSSGSVVVTPGSGKYRWTVISPGAFVDAARSKKVVDTASQVLVIYTDDFACGVIAVRVNDGCTALTREIRAETGQWLVREIIYREDFGANDDELDALAAGFIDTPIYLVDVTPAGIGEAIQGRWKVGESIIERVYEGASSYPHDPCPNWVDHTYALDDTRLVWTYELHVKSYYDPIYEHVCTGIAPNFVVYSHLSDRVHKYTTGSIIKSEWVC